MAVLKVTKEQLYSMAAVAKAGEPRQIAIDLKVWEQDLKKPHNLRCAVAMGPSSPKQRAKDAHENGWAYYDVEPDGTIKVLKENEL
jgi:hypothetical protein